MKRIDVLLVERKLSDSRTHAQNMIKAGRVKALENGSWCQIKKPSHKLDEATEFDIQHDIEDQFVSRGALKLLGAIDTLNISVKDYIALDVGCSTGGFTDCLLQQGAKKVVGVDVGHDQLHPKLANDPRVVLYEGMNAREMPAETLLSHTAPNQGFDIAVMDVSFISQTKILPALIPLLKESGELVSLVKPQFEVGKEGIGKNGIVKDKSLYKEVKTTIISCAESLGLEVLHFMESPIKGGDGNIEFLLYGRKQT